MAGKKDIVEQALKLIAGGAKEAGPSVAERTAKNLDVFNTANRLGVDTNDIAKLQETKRLMDYHKGLMGDVKKNAQSLAELQRQMQEQGAFPMEVGTRFTTPHSQKFGQPAHVVMGYYVDPKNPSGRYGYRVRQEYGDGNVTEQMLMIRDPKLEALHGPEKWEELQRGFVPMTGPKMVKASGGRTGYQTKGRVVGDAVDAAMRLITGGAETAAPKIRAYHASPYDFDVFKPSEFRGSTFFASTPERAKRGADAGRNEMVMETATDLPPENYKTYEVEIDPTKIRGLHLAPSEIEWFSKLPNKIVGDEALETATRAGMPHGLTWDDFYDYQPISEGVFEYTKKAAPPSITYEDAYKTGRDVYRRQHPHYAPDADEKASAKRMRQSGMGGYMLEDEGGTSLAISDPEIVRILRKYASGGRTGYGPGGVIDDIVKMAGKIVSGADGKVTRLSDVRSARETDALIKQLKSAVSDVQSGRFQAGRQALINQKSLDLHKSGMLPLQQGTIVTPPSTWDMPGDWRVSGYWYDEKDPRRFGYKLQNESGQTYDAAASDPRAGLRRDNPYSFGAGFKAYAGPNAAPPKPIVSPVEKPAIAPSPPEVLDAINKEYEDLFKNEDPFKPKAHGGRIAKGPGGFVDDIVKMAGKLISGADEPAKTGIRAYQGSPHNFAAERLVRFPDKTEQYIVGTPNVLPDVPEGADVIQDFPLGRMRMDKIGTGEGAQAYGHGLYAAEHEPVARGYRDALSRPLNTGDLGRDLANYAVSQKRGSVDDAIAYLNREMSNYDTRPAGWPSPEYKKQYEDALNILQSGGYKPAGHMYEVNINADPNTFLDWDKPLSEQSEAVKNMLARLPGAPDQSVWPYTTGNDLYEQLRVDAMGDDAFMQATPQRLAARKAAAPEVTRMLGEAGIPGIKYLDAGSRGKGVAYVQPMYKGKPYSDPIPAHAWNQVDQLVNDYKAKGFDVEVQDLGTRNYVVFDDKLISIIRKYGIAGASAMLGYNLMEQLDPKQALAASMADQDYQSSRPQRSMGGNNSISGALNVARGLHGGM